MSEQNFDPDFQRFYDQYVEKLYRWATYFIKDPEDEIQDVFVKIYEKKIDISLPPDKLNGLLLTIVRRTCIDASKKNASRNRAHDGYGNIAYSSDTSFLKGADPVARFQLKWGLMIEESKKLPTVERRVFECVCLNRMPIEDYARLYGVNPQTVRNQKARALKKIRKNLENRSLDISLIITLFLH